MSNDKLYLIILDLEVIKNVLDVILDVRPWKLP